MASANRPKDGGSGGHDDNDDDDVLDVVTDDQSYDLHSSDFNESGEDDDDDDDDDEGDFQTAPASMSDDLPTGVAASDGQITTAAAVNEALLSAARVDNRTVVPVAHDDAKSNNATETGDDDDAETQNEGDDGVIVNFLGKVNEIAEARLAQRRQARAEAREIRMRELERQQKEQEQNADRVFDMHSTSGASGLIDPIARSRLTLSGGSSGGGGGSGTLGGAGGSMLPSLRGTSMSSRRSSEDSLEEEGRSLRDIRHELKEVEERFRKAMIANAQLDNERASQTYQIQLLKDKLEEMEESYAQLQREHKDKCRDHDALRRGNDKLSDELKLVQGQLSERDQLITEQGLTIVIVETEDGTDARRSLVSVENAHLLETVQGSLDVRLKRFADEKTSLKAEVQHLTQQLEEIRVQRRAGTTNGPLGDEEYEEAQREANKQLADYRYKLQRAEQEIASLQSSLLRSETQLIRFKSSADASEKMETDLKSERRKLQRENREMSERLEELETANNHLMKRLEKLKNAKSALLKDL